MPVLALLAGAVLALSPAGAAAQPAPPAHEQHPDAAAAAPTAHDHQSATSGQCCCEQMMKDMHAMMETMMQMHQGMDMKMPKSKSPSVDKGHVH